MKKHLMPLLLCVAALLGTATPLKADALPGGLAITIGGASMNTDNCRNFTSDYIVKGHISYDIENRVLRLQNVLLQGEASCMLRISGSTTPVTIDIQGSCQIIDNYSGDDGCAMSFEMPVVLTSTQKGSLDISGYKICGIRFSQQLTVKGGLELDINTGSWGMLGVKDGNDEYPDLVIDGSALSLRGNTASIDQVRTLSLTDSNLPEGITWNSEAASPQKNGSKYTDQLKITRAAGVTYLYVTSTGGKVSISDTETGGAIDNPVKIKEQMSIRLTAEDTGDYTFLKWSDGNTVPNRTMDVISFIDVNLTAYFVRKAKTNAPWYVFFGATFKKFTDGFGTETTLGMNTTPAYNGFTTGAGFRYTSDNKAALLYAMRPTEGKKAGFRFEVLNMDNMTVQEDNEIIAPQDNYYPVYAINYSTYDKTFYCCAKRTSDGTNCLLKIDVENKTLSEVHALTDIKNPITAMTSGIYGELYLMEADKADAALWIVRFITKSALPSHQKLGRTGVGSSDVLYNALGYDHATGELLWLQNGEYARVINTGDCTCDYLARHISTDPMMMFQMTSPCNVKLKAADPQTGNVFFSGNIRDEGNFVPGAEVALFAQAATYRRFVRWTDGNTDNPRIVKIDSKVPEYVAEFDWAEDVTAYNISVGETQFLSKRTKLTHSNETSIASGDGFVAFDPATNTLTLDNAIIVSNNESLITIGEEGEEGQPLTVRVNGTVTLYAQNAKGCCFRLNNTDVTFTGTGTLNLNAQNQSSCISLNASDLTFHGAKVNMDSKGAGINGTGSETLTVNGSDMSVKGSSGSITGIAQLESGWCDISSPVGAEFNPQTQCVEVSGSTVKTKVVFKKWPELRIEPVQEGTGTFTLRSEEKGDEFTDVGWFKTGDNITVTARPADGFVFARWTEDPYWGNDSRQDEWWTEEITRTKSANDEILSALFYYDPQSSATWYAINGNKFVSFTMSDHAGHPEKASAPSASGVKAGDYRSGNWELRKSSGITVLPFSGLTDGEELPGKDEEETIITNSTLQLTDMAYDISNDVMYATDGTSLYSFNYEKRTIDLVGKFFPGVQMTAIAVALDGTIYGIVPDAKEAQLFKVVEIDTDKSIVGIVNVTGIANGTMGIPVTGSGYSLAFDHVTGELFFGNSDYIYSVAPETGKAYICGDLGMKKGVQGAVTAMHRMHRFVSAKAKVADDCEDMGTVSVSKSRVIAGSKVTFTAQPNSGYEFSYWTKENDDKKVSTDSELTVTVKSKVTYVAYFEKAAGIGEVNADTDGGVQKLLIGGTLYILRDGRIYTPAGQLVK